MKLSIIGYEYKSENDHYELCQSSGDLNVPVPTALLMIPRGGGGMILSRTKFYDVNN